VNALAGLPDFSALVSSEVATAFAPFSGGSYAVVPQRAMLATDSNGNPDVLLELFQQMGDFTASGSHAVLDLTVGWDFPLDAALVEVRANVAGGTVQPLSIHSGFARLYPTSTQVAPAADLLTPVPLGWLSPDGARWTPRLSADAGELIKGSLAGGSLLLGVRVEFDAAGVAQRTPVSVQFDPVALLNALLAGKASRSMAVADVLAVFTQSTGLPLKTSGTATPDFAQAMTDRVVATFASLTAAPGLSDPSTVAFVDASALTPGTIAWDLSQPALAYRQWVLELDATSELRAAVAKNGLDFFVKEVTAPPLEAGVYSIDVTANLPPNRNGVPAIGANIELAANPPFRPASSSVQVVLAEPSDRGSAVVHLSPDEPFGYGVRSFALLVIPGTLPVELDAPAARPCSDAWVTLTADDFLVTFAHVTAADRLLALATVTIALQYTYGGRATLQQFTLTSANPSVSVGIPRDATSASLQLSAQPSDGGAPLALAAMQPGRINVDLPLFREYGPHTIDVSADFSSSGGTLVLELQSEGQSADPTATPDLLMLTAAQPSSTWGYVAASPFHPGYRYRRSATPPTPASAWSPVLSPFQPLLLDADGTMSASASASTSAPIPLAASS
jgi:hypothetical protein